MELVVVASWIGEWVLLILFFVSWKIVGALSWMYSLSLFLSPSNFIYLRTVVAGSFSSFFSLPLSFHLELFNPRDNFLFVRIECAFFFLNTWDFYGVWGKKRKYSFGIYLIRKWLILKCYYWNFHKYEEKHVDLTNNINQNLM